MQDCTICGEAYEEKPGEAMIAIVTRLKEDGSEHEYKVCDPCFGRVIEPLIGCKPRLNKLETSFL